MSTTTKPFIASGGHDAGGEKCVMEWAAYLAGEKHSDMPDCVSPVLRRYMMRLNDNLPDAPRQRLGMYILRSLGTAGDGKDDERRAICRAFWVKRLPELLDKAGLPEAAEKVRNLPADLQSQAALKILREVRDETSKVRWARRDALYANVKKAVAAELKKKGKSEPAVAAAVADADADLSSTDRYWKIRDAVYNAVYAKCKAAAQQALGDVTYEAAFELLDEMLPAKPVMKPVKEAAPVAKQLAKLAA